jgi:hypothetical protein
LPARLPEAIAFVQQSFWGKFGIFARAATPTLDIGWVTLLALLVGAVLGQAARLAVSRQPDRDTAALLGLWLLGGGLLVAQTFAPLLSFAAEGLWLPQGRYLFSGMGLIAPVMGVPAINRPVYAGILAAIFAILTIALASECAVYFS